MGINTLITFIILIFSAIVHEVMHGVVAEKFGDDTAREEGRITLNPIPHIDPFGTLLLPFFLLAIGSPIILGAAKPVPVNYNNMRNPKLGMICTALAGPLSNIALAILFVIPIKFGLTVPMSYDILFQAIIINIVLGVFNLIPIPPLDGSKVVAAFLPPHYLESFFRIERYGFILVFVFLYLGLLDKLLLPIVYFFIKIFGLGGSIY